MAPLRQQLFVVGYTIALLVGLAALWFRPAVSDWPAWVQAVGSVGAILVAVWSSQWQAERARQERLIQRREFRAAVAGLARRLSDLISRDAVSFHDDVEFYHFEGFSPHEYDLLDAALNRFDPSKLDSAEAVLALEQLRSDGKNALSWQKALVEEFRGERGGDDENLVDGLARWAANAEAAAQTLRALVSDDSHHPSHP